jgi:hypothetical protein
VIAENVCENEIHGVMRTFLKFAIYFTVSLTLVLILQVLSGAYQSELAHQPDEPSHVASALMTRDFLAASSFQNPIRFAETYYAHYPKSAIGIWPPGYYLAAGIWLLLFGASKTALLMLSASVTAMLATVVALFAEKSFGSPVALALGLFLITLPQVQDGSSMFMLDIPVTIMQFLAMWCFIKFIQTDRTSTAILFALLVVMAMLTKGNAMALVLLPPVFIVLTRRWDILKRKRLYLIGFLVAVLALPWQIVSVRILKNSGLQNGFSIDYMMKLLVGYLHIIFHGMGPLLFVLAILGLVVECGRLWQVNREKVSIELIGAASLLFSTFLFHVLMPYPGPDDRYMMTAYPCLVLFFAAGVRWIATSVRVPFLSPASFSVVISAICILSFAHWTFAIPNRPKLGYSEAAVALFRLPLTESTILVCSDTYGEGAFISELALLDKRPQHVVLRGSKILSDNVWSENTYKPLFKDAVALRDFLRSISLHLILIDWTAANWDKDRLILTQVLADPTEKWTPIYDNPGTGGTRHLTIYRQMNPDTNKSKDNIIIKMPHTYGKDIIIEQ